MNQKKAVRFNQQMPTQLPMELSDFNDKLRAIVHPQKQDLLESFQRVIRHSQQRLKITNMILDAVAQLRLDVKYLAFDLEITKQERESALRQLEELQ